MSSHPDAAASFDLRATRSQGREGRGVLCCGVAGAAAPPCGMGSSAYVFSERWVIRTEVSKALFDTMKK